MSDATVRHARNEGLDARDRCEDGVRVSGRSPLTRTIDDRDDVEDFARRDPPLETGGLSMENLQNMLVIETAAAQWFAKMSPRERQAYVRAHPKSKYAKNSGGTLTQQSNTLATKTFKKHLNHDTKRLGADNKYRQTDRTRARSKFHWKMGGHYDRATQHYSDAEEHYKAGRMKAGNAALVRGHSHVKKAETMRAAMKAPGTKSHTGVSRNAKSSKKHALPGFTKKRQNGELHRETRTGNASRGKIKGAKPHVQSKNASAKGKKVSAKTPDKLKPSVKAHTKTKSKSPVRYTEKVQGGRVKRTTHVNGYKQDD